MKTFAYFFLCCLSNYDAAGIPGADRQIVLFKLVNALANQLRGVFAPYYKTLAELMVGHLGGSRVTVSGISKKKRSITRALSEYDGPDAPFLRYQARLLADCFLYLASLRAVVSIHFISKQVDILVINSLQLGL